MILLEISLLFLFRYSRAFQLNQECRDSELSDWGTQADHIEQYLIAYDPLRGRANSRPLLRTAHWTRLNTTGGCRKGRIRDWNGLLIDVQLPPYIERLETYGEPAVSETALFTYNSTWTAYMDWRQRRHGTVIVTNNTKYEDIHTAMEFPFRITAAALSYKEEFDRLIGGKNRFFRISTTAVSGEMSIRPRQIDHLDQKLVEYFQAALDGRRILEPVNTLLTWNKAPQDIKAHNWHVIFSDTYGTHYPTSIKFGYIFDLWINRSTCLHQPEAKLSELAQCYFAETKLNLSLPTPSSQSPSTSHLSSSGTVEICPHLKSALLDLRLYLAHPSGHLERLTIDTKHVLSDYLKRIPEESRSWQPTIVEAKMTPICELVPLVAPNDLDAKVACETSLLNYMRSIEPIDNRRSSVKCKREERSVLTTEGSFCISTRFSDVSCPNRAGEKTVGLHRGDAWIIWCLISIFALRSLYQ